MLAAVSIEKREWMKWWYSLSELCGKLNFHALRQKSARKFNLSQFNFSAQPFTLEQDSSFVVRFIEFGPKCHFLHYLFWSQILNFMRENSNYWIGWFSKVSNNAWLFHKNWFPWKVCGNWRPKNSEIFGLEEYGDPDDNIFILTFSNFGRSAHTDFLETFKAALETLDMPKSEFGVISQFTTKVGLQRVLISVYHL